MPDNRNLTGVHLFCRDVTASVAFYRRLGVAIREEAIWPGNGQAHNVEAKMPGGVSLELDSWALTKAYDSGWQEPSGPARGVMSFAVATREGVDALYADMTGAGYRGHLAPFDAFWGARYAVIEDPDGNQVGLISPTDPARGGPPPKL